MNFSALIVGAAAIDVEEAGIASVVGMVLFMKVDIEEDAAGAT